jgi:acetoacetate decarboxylase
VSAYPPAPWELRGRVALVPVPVRASAARAVGLPPGARLMTAGPWTLGGVLLADYDETATLRYRELIVFSALASPGGPPAFVVSHIYVDLDASLAGGRAIWGLPKELASFSADAGRIAVRAADGRGLATIAVRRRARSARLPLWAGVIGTLGGAAARTATTGSLRGSLASAEVDVPPESPLRTLGLGGRHAALAGDRLALPFPPPHEPDRGAIRASGFDPDVCTPVTTG